MTRGQLSPSNQPRDQAGKLRDQLAQLLKSPGCGFRHERGWQHGGYQQMPCKQELRDLNLHCAHNDQGNRAVREAVKFLRLAGYIDENQALKLSAYLYRGTADLFEADVLTHFTAIRVLSRTPGATLTAADRIDAESPHRRKMEQSLMGKVSSTAAEVDSRAMQLQRVAGAPITEVADLCRRLLGAYVRTAEGGAQFSPEQGRLAVDAFIRRRGLRYVPASMASSSSNPWHSLTAPTGAQSAPRKASSTAA